MNVPRPSIVHHSYPPSWPPPYPWQQPYPLQPPPVQPFSPSQFSPLVNDREEILTRWQQSVSCTSDHSSATNTTIPGVTGDVKIILDSLLALKKLHSNLSSVSVENSEELWVQVTMHRQAAQKSIECLHKRDSKVLEAKLKRNQRRRKRMRAMKEEEKERQSNVHKACSDWLSKEQNDLMRKKLEESVEREASGALGEVSRKIQDLDNMVALMAALKELREHRSSNKKWKIDGPPRIRADETFTHKCLEIEEVVSKRLKDYRDEEYALKVMMSKKVDAKMTAAQSQHKEPSSGDPIKDYYHQAQRDLSSYIRVRHKWDRYLAPHGSTIPSNWVEPVLPSNCVWASYIVTDEQKL